MASNFNLMKNVAALMALKNFADRVCETSGFKLSEVTDVGCLGNVLVVTVGNRVLHFSTISREEKQPE
jgi:hypothetical protein